MSSPLENAVPPLESDSLPDKVYSSIQELDRPAVYVQVLALAQQFPRSLGWFETFPQRTGQTTRILAHSNYFKPEGETAAALGLGPFGSLARLLRSLPARTRQGSRSNASEPTNAFFTNRDAWLGSEGRTSIHFPLHAGRFSRKPQGKPLAARIAASEGSLIIAAIKTGYLRRSYLRRRNHGNAIRG